MPAKKEMTMRQMRQLLRLHASGASDREIGRTVGAARSTVRDAIQRAKSAGLSWPLPVEVTDAALEEKLFARPNTNAGVRRRPEPDWAVLVRELKRPGVTIAGMCAAAGFHASIAEPLSEALRTAGLPA